MTAKKRLLAGISLAALAALVWFSATIFLDWRDQRRYPLEYMEYISPYALEYGLDEYLVLSVIKVESNFRPVVISSAGALGLMQIMPDTGGWIAQKLDDKAYEESWLVQPEHNIRYGCWYLRYLLDRYDQDLDKAAAAYNAGGGNVDKWLKDPEIANETGALMIDKIPFSQTKSYVQKVHKAYAEYQRIYPDR